MANASVSQGALLKNRPLDRETSTKLFIRNSLPGTSPSNKEQGMSKDGQAKIKIWLPLNEDAVI